MKVKQTPGDFFVEELTDAVGGPRGDFALYRLDKIGWTTHDAIRVLKERWQIESRRVNYGGLKDRHAETVQYLTVFRGPKRNLEHQRLRFTFLGLRTEPYSSHDIRANRFRITLRSLGTDDIRRAIASAQIVQTIGVPNYFDDQRFGSVTAEGQFIGRELVLGQFETALKLALAAPYKFDRAETKREKQTLTEHWGQWPTCKSLLPRGHARSLVDYLVHHPTDFKGAFARLRAELASLYLSAYQSALWNRFLARRIRGLVPAQQLGSIDLDLGPLPVHLESGDREALGVPLPLPSARLKPEPDAPWLADLDAVLEEEGLTLKQLKIPGLNRPFFSRGERASVIIPAGLTARAQGDEINRGREKLILGFDLPRGSYATIVIKRLTQLTQPTTS
jgi:tRNA pseudouridine13 synthase